MTTWITVITIAVVALIGISGALAGKTASLQEKFAEYAEKYVMLEEWAEDWLKRLEQKHDALECQIVNAAARIAEMERKYGELEKMFPKDGNNEVLRHNVLLQQMNDEMERSLKMEREWNDGLSSIMNYGKPNYEVNET